MLNRYIVYALQDPISYEIRYIGKSCSGLRRPKRHFSECELKNDTNLYKVNWIRKLKKINKKPNILIIQELNNQEELCDAEFYWLSYFKQNGSPLTNLVYKKDSVIILDISTKKKLSLLSKKRWENVEFRKKHSALVKASQTQQVKEKMKLHSQKLAKDPKFLKFRGEQISKGRCKKILCITNNTIYNSSKEASKILNLSRSEICRALKDINIKIKGYQFRRAENV